MLAKLAKREEYPRRILKCIYEFCNATEAILREEAKRESCFAAFPKYR